MRFNLPVAICTYPSVRLADRWMAALGLGNHALFYMGVVQL